MTAQEKLDMLRSLIGPEVIDASEEVRLNAYLSAAAKEIISWRYSYSGKLPEEVPEEYEMAQIMAVVAGYSQSGAEGQATHSENGISRTFNYPDMLHYIRRNVIHKIGVL